MLVGFGALVLLAARLTLRARPPRVLRVLKETVHTTGQTAVRVSVLLLALLVFVAADAGFEFVLGAFAAGMIVGLALESPEGAVVRMRLEGIGFGFLVPVYFVATGMTFDLDSLLTASGLALAALFLALLLVTRGTAALPWAWELPRREGSPRIHRGWGSGRGSEAAPLGIFARMGIRSRGFPILRQLVEPAGLEPATFWLPARRSPS